MPVSVFPVVVLLIGLIVYVLSTNGKAAEIGRLAFFVGLLVLVFVLADQTVRVVR